MHNVDRKRKYIPLNKNYQNDVFLYILYSDQDLYCGVCLKVVSAPERPNIITDTTVIMGSTDNDNKEACPKCGGKVGTSLLIQQSS